MALGEAGGADRAVGVLIGVFFGVTVVVRHRLGDEWAGVAQWLPIAPSLAVVAWEHRFAGRAPRARRVVWAGLAMTILSVLAGLALLRAHHPAGTGTEVLAVAVVAVPMVVASLALRAD